MSIVEPISRKPRYPNQSRGNNDHERRLVALETKVEAMTGTVEQVKTDTAEILTILVQARSATGFVRKHGPRVLAACVGALIMTGKISAETGQNFLHLLGL